jgi:hypothetical protein
MSKAEDRRVYATDVQTLRSAIVEAGKGVKLTKEVPDGNTVQLNEPFTILAFTWPAKLVATMSDEGGATAIAFRVSNFGFGPIQSGHVRKKLEHITAALAQYEKK